jgi:amidohydrolase
MATPELFARLGEAVRGHTPRLLELSHDLHDHPELGFEERYAHAALTTVLGHGGLEVEPSAFGLETAFAARAGTNGPLIAVICEYDALPELGHACGHNIIAAAGVGAALALAPLAEELGGRLVVLGTPAEEGGGGKELLLRAGAFDEVEAALMVHPADCDAPGFRAVAMQRMTVVFRGSAAHAAAAPSEGRNALDAAVLAYQAVAALRQHIAEGERVHGVFTDGGSQANVVPERAAMEWYVRSPTFSELQRLEPRVEACMRAGAEAAGCDVHVEWHDPAFADLVHSDVLGRLFAANAAALGRAMQPGCQPVELIASTDLGNVSQRLPVVHPLLAIARKGIAPHTTAFAAAARSGAGDAAIVDGAIALAATVTDLWTDPTLLRLARERHDEARCASHEKELR